VNELRVHQLELEMQNRELRESQQLLEDSRRRYADLYDLAPVGYCTIGVGGVVLDANVEAARLLGMSHALLVGRPLTSVVKTDFARFHAHLQTCLQKRERATCELSLTLRNGVEVVVQMVSRPLDSDGWPAPACMTTLTDISVLKHSEERLAILLSVSEVLASSLDYRETLPGVVRRVVPALGDLSFVDVVDRRGRVMRFEAEGAPSAIDYAQAPQADVLRSGRPVIVGEASAATLAATLGHQLDGASVLDSVAQGSVMLIPVSARGRTLGVFTFVIGRAGRVHSRHERRLAQEVGVQTAMAIERAQLYEDAQQAIHSREELLAVVSHDLKNPLHGLRLMSDLLLEMVPADDRYGARPHLEAIRRGVRRTLDMLRDLSEQARIEAGHLVLEKGGHCLRALVDDVVELLSPLAAEKQIALARTAAVPAIGISCDRARVLQILSNIVGNAVKFTPPGGEVALDVTVGQVAARFVVRDSGPGIDAHQLGHIFERYWRADEQRAPGSGLGLFIAKEIVEAHGGDIGADSVPDRGTTVWFTLPLGEANEEAGTSG
jgi:PAS domain S-box-containing protein